mgnify:CR=1 FL=1
MLKSLIFLFLAMFSNFALAASPHLDIQNRDEISQKHSISLENTKIDIYTRSGVDVEEMSRAIQNSFSILPGFFDNIQSCKNLDIAVYEISRSTLNDRRTMSFLNWRSWNNLNITGTYDSIYSPRGSSSIFLTSDRGKEAMIETLIHEIAHYWQDTRCIPVAEPKAYEFEKFYKTRFP